MASSSPRILVCGDVFGHLNQLFKRVQSVNKSSGPFDALLCVGQFFPQSMDEVDEIAEIIDGKVHVPIPTYFIGNYGAGAAKYLSKIGGLGFKMDGIEICKNLFWLKGSGKFSLHGLLVVYLAGRKMPDVAEIGGYNEDDVDALRALVDDSGIFDIFLTNEWPSGVSNGSNASDVSHVVSDTTGSDSVVAELASELKPRYHFAGTKGVFFAREPYCNGDAAHVTRFVGLAAVGNKDKQKFIHAISPTPASAMSPAEIQSRPPNTTLSPYIIATKSSHTREENKRPADNDVNAQYWRYDVSQKRQRQGADRLCFKFTSTGSCTHGEKCNFGHDDAAREQSLRNVCFDFLNKGKCEKGSDCRFGHSFVGEGNKSNKPSTHGRRSYVKCWFCLSSPDVESHLILSIGEYYYCALAKGPLVQDHVLLVPVEHHPNTITMALKSEPELGRYKNALNLYFRNQGNSVIFFEWISRRSVHAAHANIQAIPIPLSKASSALRAFSLASKTVGFEFTLVSKSMFSSTCFHYFSLHELLNVEDWTTKANFILGNHNNEGRSLLRSTFDGKSNFFYVELPEGIVLSYAPNKYDKFPIQFGREVIAGLLNIADKADWRNCKMSKEKESQMVENFKKGFEQYDPAS